jgi:hypothetical protein
MRANRHDVPYPTETTCIQKAFPQWSRVLAFLLQSRASVIDAGIHPRSRLVRDVNCGIEVRLVEKLAYTAHDFADEGVALGRSFMSWEGRNLENRDYDGVSVETEIDGERIKEGVSNRG